MKSENVQIKNDNYQIPGTYVYPDDMNKKVPCMLLLHGFLSSKNGDGELLVKVAEGLASKAVASLRIDFCSCGENIRDRKYYNIDNLIIETKKAYEEIKNNKLIDTSRIGILGHSLGGLVSFKVADLNPKCIITLNGAMKSNLYEHYLSIKDEFKEGYYIMPQSDGRNEKLYESFYKCDNLTNNIYPKYDGKKLMCIGESDPRILPSWQHEYAKSINADVISIADANHTFNAKTGDYTKVNELIEAINNWLSQYFI